MVNLNVICQRVSKKWVFKEFKTKRYLYGLVLNHTYNLCKFWTLWRLVMHKLFGIRYWAEISGFILWAPFIWNLKLDLWQSANNCIIKHCLLTVYSLISLDCVKFGFSSFWAFYFNFTSHFFIRQKTLWVILVPYQKNLGSLDWYWIIFLYCLPLLLDLVMSDGNSKAKMILPESQIHVCSILGVVGG